VGTNRCGNRGLRICHWALLDCTAAVDGFAGTSGSPQWPFGVDGSDVDNIGRAAGGRRALSISQDTRAPRAGEVRAGGICAGPGDGVDRTVWTGVGRIFDLHREKRGMTGADARSQKGV